MASPNQPQVNEGWVDQRIRGFLELRPFGDQSADFHVLLKAYQGMRAADFERFIGFFIDAGRDVNARDDKGRTILEIISNHKHAAGYIKVLEERT